MFNKNATQFWVAILSMTGVCSVVFLLTWGAVFRSVDLGIALGAYSGLTGIAGTAAAWLFRVNGASK